MSNIKLRKKGNGQINTFGIGRGNVSLNSKVIITNAKNMPNLEILEKKLNIKIDRLVSSKDRVYIPLNIV